MGKSMRNHECEWVGARLPLWVDNGERNGPTEADGDRGDLTARERRQIERHLADCALCRHHRMALEEALGALAVAATHLPVLSEAPSLWPSLERRIANRDANPTGHRSQAGGVLAGRSVQPWGTLDSVRPLRQAWTRDTLREVLAGRNHQQPESRRLSGLIPKISVAAAVLITLTGIAVARRQWKNAQSTILANSVPPAYPVPVPLVIDERLPLETADRDDNEASATQLAEAESSRPTETPASGIDALAVPKPSQHTRFGFDLEHGTHMPRDTREAKPVY
jgi:hypothetical protein